MRRLLFVLGLLFILAFSACAAVVFVFRDKIILDEVRSRLAALPEPKIQIGALHTDLFGSPVLQLEDIQISQGSGTTIRAKEARLSSSLSLWSLVSAVRAGNEIPLVLSLSHFAMLQPPSQPSSGSEAAPASPWPKAIELPALFPLPVKAELSLLEGEWKGAGTEARKISGKISLRGNPKGFELEGQLQLVASAPGAEAFIPLAFEAKLAGAGNSVKLTKFALKAAGLEANGNGELNVKPVSGKLVLNAEAADLSRLNIRAEDRSTLGLTGQPSGSLSLKMAAAAGPEGAIAASGLVHLNGATFPLKIPEHTLWSSLAKDLRLEGAVGANADLPFRAQLHWPLQEAAKVTVEKANVSLDLTAASLSKKGLLEKPKGVALQAMFQGSARPEEITVDSFSLLFHTLKFKSTGRLPAPYGSTVAGNFDFSVTSLAGFPALLPMLKEEQAGASLADARGSLAATGRVLMPVANPAQSFVELQMFSVKDIRLPLAFENTSLEAKGVLLGSASGKGIYDAGALNVTHSTGNFDLTDLGLVLKDKLTKKRGRKLRFAFDAKGNQAKLQIAKMTLEADGLNAGLSGNVSFPAKGVSSLQLVTSAKAELAPLREYLPKLPAKISGGNLEARMQVSGQWLADGGIEKSPLSIAGKITGKLGSVVLPESPPAAKPAAKAPPPSLPAWPVLQNSKLEFHLELAQFTQGALTAAGVLLAGKLDRGTFNSDLTVAKTFGGKANLRHLTGSLLEPKFPVRGSLLLEGIDLSQAAGYVDPTYEKIVRGFLSTNSTFSLPSLWADSLLDTVSVSGQADVAKGYLSTASFDTLVNEKLAKIPGLGGKAKMNTGGMEAEIHSRFQMAQGVANLLDMVASTPKKDEMRLKGTLAMNFDCDLSGEAHLASAPVSGPILEANSDPQGRLVVPVRFHGNLKAPQADIATGAIEAMLAKTATNEGNKVKAKVVDTAKSKLEEAAKGAAGGLLNGLLKKK